MSAGQRPPSVLPDISPTRGEIGSFHAPLIPTTVAICEAGVTAISPQVGEMSGRTEGGAKDRYRTGLHSAPLQAPTLTPFRRNLHQQLG
ncbi:hypothetical protein BQ8794_130319 [Mesorhizobium prunaredense]|uniref:Uncharacterized protein n=1 Tax=Mesorhizobium prunaredense TaxID=1631249 RepID=A0A1R3V514_9HYPH|nr:hypothetical protein BQ8794_130319 [Mesorhizobium prunaredense]